MPSNPTTYTLLMDLGAGPFMAASQVPSGYQSPPEQLVVTNPVEFIIDIWERYAESGGTKLDLPSTAVGKLYMTLADSGIARTAVTTGVTLTVSAVEAVYQRLTVAVTAGTFPESFCCGTKTRLVFELETSLGVVIATFFVDVQMVDAQGGYTVNPRFTSADETVDVDVVTADATLTATAGPRVILIDPTAGAVTLTLPASTAKTPGQHITFVALNVANTITIELPGVETFGGTTETDFTIETANEAHECLAFYDAAIPLNSWYHLNWIEVLT